MKKFLISTIYIALAIGVLKAQDVKFGIRGGMNLSNMMAGGKSTPVSEDYKSRTAVGAGIFTELQLNPMFSVRFGVEYSQMGGKKNGMQALPSMRLINEMGNSLGMLASSEQIAGLQAIAGVIVPQYPYYYANIDNTVKMDYVMIPVLAQVGWDIGETPWRVYVNAGPFVSFILSGKQAAKGNSKMFADASGTRTLWDIIPPPIQDNITEIFPGMVSTLSDPVSFGTTNITGELKSTNFGITGNVGIRYQCGRNYFFLEAGGNYGFITVQNDDANGSNRLGAATVMAGYSFSLF